ncbi:4-hydroxyphenylpyruvate dioxygenase-like protein [Mya arenaria]|uniref:4-hydroxyphenylpyruvate dioxygenase-like protein n=1 Tax=Mya arenaria TaxID=6604 RepID=UPI0022E5D46F|nr:4-hydroxyphenylpyruvate dioxygenase-like protein [Mya arenaria]
MQDCCVHHVEFGVRNGEEYLRKFKNQYKFALVATRFTKHLKQWVLLSGTARILLTQQMSPLANSVSDVYHVPWSRLLQANQEPSLSSIDSVYNVALQVKNIQAITERLSRSGVTIAKPLQTASDNHGEVKLAIVRSCIGNVVHTLIEDAGYKGPFLPQFTPVSDSGDQSQKLTTHLDHVTFACDSGDSGRILDWYSNCFGMRRFLISRDEDEASGFVIDSEDIGVRLKAFEYWKCAETGLTTGNRPDSIKFVIAEALPNQGPNQVDTFLHDHEGPGIQHIGLHTDNIVSTVAQLKDNGVEFAEPPYTYYTEVGKLEEICDIGEDVDLLRENGILVDAEADPGDGEGSGGGEGGLRYLMQKFTKPLSDRNTFFLEIIQRVGARGFGSGNITALWRSVQAYMNSQKENKS